jgi:hypothetical protein
MWGLVPGLWFVVLRNFIASLERPRAGMVVMFFAVGFNALADYGLIFGAFGLPALGLRGAGIATALTNACMFLGLLGYVLVDRRFRRFQILGRLWRPDPAHLREIFRIGLPIGVTLVMEVGLFATAGFLIGLIGTAQLAAHQIALQCASVTFMVPLGLAQAATVRVGLAAGAGDAEGVRRAGVAALAIGGAFMLAMATLMWTAPRAIVGLFIDLGAPTNAPVVHAAVTFLARVLGRRHRPRGRPRLRCGLGRARRLDRARRCARRRGLAHGDPVRPAAAALRCLSAPEDPRRPRHRLSSRALYVANSARGVMLRTARQPGRASGWPTRRSSPAR